MSEMTTGREAIYSALFALVKGAATPFKNSAPLFKTASRRFRVWTEIATGDQPAFLQVQRTETPTTTTGQPPIWRYEVDLVFYVNAGNDPDTAPSIALNSILDTVVALFGNEQKLGGLVHYVRISGQVQTDEGVLGAQAFAIIPIEILTA